MKKLVQIFMIFACLVSVQNSQARDTRYKLSIQDALNSPEAKAKLDPSIKFSFGSKAKVKLAHDFGEFMSNKKTYAANKTDKEACTWAFLSAMLSFQNRARQMNADSVTNIHSYYKKNRIDSNEVFECGAGAMVAGVTFKAHVGKSKTKK